MQGGVQHGRWRRRCREPRCVGLQRVGAREKRRGGSCAAGNGRAARVAQMEIEYFIRAETWPEAHQEWLKRSMDWLVSIGLRQRSCRPPPRSRAPCQPLLCSPHSRLLPTRLRADPSCSRTTCMPRRSSRTTRRPAPTSPSSSRSASRTAPRPRPASHHRAPRTQHARAANLDGLSPPAPPPAVDVAGAAGLRGAGQLRPHPTRGGERQEHGVRYRAQA